MRYVKKIAFWFMFIVTGFALYIIVRDYEKTDDRITGNIDNIHKSNKRIKTYLNSAESNVKESAANNTKALNLISRLENNNERFRKLILEIQKSSKS